MRAATPRIGLALAVAALCAGAPAQAARCIRDGDLGILSAPLRAADLVELHLSDRAERILKDREDLRRSDHVHAVMSPTLLRVVVTAYDRHGCIVRAAEMTIPQFLELLDAGRPLP